MKGKIISIVILVALLMGGCKSYDSIEEGNVNYPPINPTPTKEHDQITLYYPDTKMTYLFPETRVLSLSTEDMGEVVIKELLKGPSRRELVSVIPSNTELLSFDIIKGVAYVNLSSSFINSIYSQKQEALLIYSLVNTLTRLESINEVQILIEGNLRDEYNYYKLTNPLKYSTLITRREYINPIDVISQYYDSLLKRDYNGISKLMIYTKRGDIKSNDFKTYFQEYSSDVTSYKIKDYKITNYGKNLSIYVDIELYSHDDQIKNEKSQKFLMIYDDGELKIDNIYNNP